MPKYTETDFAGDMAAFIENDIPEILNAGITLDLKFRVGHQWPVACFHWDNEPQQKFLKQYLGDIGFADDIEDGVYPELLEAV